MKRIHGYCAILSLIHASGLPESHVLDICKFYGFRDNGNGMEDEDIEEAIEDLGIRRRRVSNPPNTVGAFLKKYPLGLFIVTTYNHIFVVLNGGVVMHPLQDKMDRRCKLENAWRVLK